MSAPVPAQSDRRYLATLSRNLEQPGTLGRLILWIKLRCGRVPGFSFVHSHAVAGYSIDFFCAQINLGIDVVPSEALESRVDDETRAGDGQSSVENKHGSVRVG